MHVEVKMHAHSLLQRAAILTRHLVILDVALMIRHSCSTYQVVLRRLRRAVHTAPRAALPPRLYAQVLSEDRVQLSAEESRHATKALRLRPGDACELFDGTGRLARGTISHIDPRGCATVEIVEPPVELAWPSSRRWHVAVACSGLGSRADWCVEKCAELGVHTFTPLLTERCTSKQQRREGQVEHERWKRLSVAASKQCLRIHSMSISPPTHISDLIQRMTSATSLVALQGGQPLHAVLNQVGLAEGGLLVVGPPGDFTEEEKRALVDVGGAVAVGLGDLRLRTETAALAMVSACSFFI